MRKEQELRLQLLQNQLGVLETKELQVQNQIEILKEKIEELSKSYEKFE